MRKSVILINAVLVGLSLVGMSQAQGSRLVEQARPESSSASVEEPLFDDDGGRVFIVGRDLRELGTLSYHGGDVVSQPEQSNIFLGAAWLQAELQQRETVFANLLANQISARDQGSLERYGVRNIFLPSVSREVPYDFGAEQAISDLQIQGALAELFKAAALPASKSDAIYVVYLPPGVSVRLGSMISGKHFAAYHNFFHGEQQVRYVVVPFESDAKLARQCAARALLEAALNPDGRGWY